MSMVGAMEDFLFGRGRKGTVRTGESPHVCRNSAGGLELEPGEGTGAAPSRDLCLPLASIGVALDWEQI